MITLALDTSTVDGSVAVYAFGEIAFQNSFRADRSHSSALFVALEKARGYAGRFDRVVVGLPLTLRGERGEQVRETERFVDALSDVTNVPVVTFDERFTTDLAEQTPADAPEDARAAAHLLSGYLTWASSAPA